MLIRKFGNINGHLIGIVMVEAVRQAMTVIRQNRHMHEAFDKKGYDGGEDIVTTADLAAQAVYVKLLRNCFPDYGIVAEENNLSVPCTHKEHDIWFTLDPLDGTKAFVRGQSDGVGTMIGLVCDDKVIAAFVGDVNTQEIYGFTPNSEGVYHLTGSSQIPEIELEISESKSLVKQNILTGSEIDRFPEPFHCFFKRQDRIFKGMRILSGSIGVLMAKLWKGEFGAYLLEGSPVTPWDLVPVLGISEELGFCFVHWNEREERFTEFQMDVSKQIRMFDTLLMLHRSRLSEFLDFHHNK